jgi:hypothetical protein
MFKTDVNIKRDAVRIHFRDSIQISNKNFLQQSTLREEYNFICLTYFKETNFMEGSYC